MIFNELSQRLQMLEQESSRLKMTHQLAQLFLNLSADEVRIVANVCMGQLQPAYQSLQFGLAAKSMVKVVARVLEVTEECVQDRIKQEGDIGSVIASGMWHIDGSLSIKDVFDRLVSLAQLSGSGSQEAKIDALVQLLQHVQPGAAKFIVRIVLSTLRLGFSDMTIIDALSWMLVGNKSLSEVIENAYNVCADIGLVAWQVKEHGLKGIERMHAIVGIPIRPAAAERLPSAQAIVDKLGECVAEPKLDGFRLQIHIDRHGATPKIYFFSRNLTDMSAMYPDLVNALSSLPVEDAIIEGEAIAFDRNTGNFMPFQETVKRKRKHDVVATSEQLPLHVYLFDLLYLNGKPMLSKGLRERRALLREVLAHTKEAQAVIHLIQEIPIHSAQQLEEYFLLQVGAGLEGVVVKRPDASYQPGKRNFNWIKLKRLEQGHLLDTVDCVVLGYYAGEGKRANFGIGAVLVGVYDEKHDAFATIAKLGTGFSDEEWRELKKRCDAIAIKNQPKNVLCHKDLAPDVWVRPEMVVEVKADELTLSPLHSAGKTEQRNGFALRFPRFMRYRDDKKAAEATTVHEVQELYKQQRVDR